MPNRMMYDSIDPAAVPDFPDAVYLGYNSGRWRSYFGIRTRFPAHTVYSCAVSAAFSADFLDIERHDATPDQAHDWLTRNPGKGLYFSLNRYDTIWPLVADLVPPVIVASYDGDPTIPILPGVVGKQYASITKLNYDVSSIVPWIPGIDPIPTNGKDDNLTSVYDPDDKQIHVFVKESDGSITHYWVQTGTTKWAKEILTVQ